MAEKSFDPLVTYGRERILIGGSFRPNGSSAIDNTLNSSKGWTVTRAGVGNYTITLDDKYAAALAAVAGCPVTIVATVQLNALADISICVLGAADVSTNKTFTIAVHTAGVAAEIASNANARVHFAVMLSNTSVYS